MIDKQYGEYILVCDICGHEVKGLDSFDEAVDYKKDDGWISRRSKSLNSRGEWLDTCKYCLEKE